MGSEFDEIAGLSAPARRALSDAGVERVEDLRSHSKTAIAGLHGMGPKGIRVLTAALAEHDWNWATTPRSTKPPSSRP